MTFSIFKTAINDPDYKAITIANMAKKYNLGKIAVKNLYLKCVYDLVADRVRTDTSRAYTLALGKLTPLDFRAIKLKLEKKCQEKVADAVPESKNRPKIKVLKNLKAQAKLPVQVQSKLVKTAEKVVPTKSQAARAMARQKSVDRKFTPSEAWFLAACQVLHTMLPESNLDVKGDAVFFTIAERKHTVLVDALSLLTAGSAIKKIVEESVKDAFERGAYKDQFRFAYEDFLKIKFNYVVTKRQHLGQVLSLFLDKAEDYLQAERDRTKTRVKAKTPYQVGDRVAVKYVDGYFVGTVSMCQPRQMHVKYDKGTADTFAINPERIMLLAPNLKHTPEKIDSKQVTVLANKAKMHAK